ncbi:tetratricopeptide repeat protein [Aliikangiella sp. IMCC44632]
MRALLVLKSCLAGLSIAVLFSCSSTPKVSTPLTQEKTAPIVFLTEFGERQVELMADDIFQLSEPQITAFYKYLKSPQNKNVPRNKLVSNYLQQRIKGFNYYSETYTAKLAAQNNAGNCMSLAVLTTAYAKLAGVPVGYQLMRTPPVFQKKGSIIFNSQHVRSLLFEDKTSNQDGVMSFFRAVIKIDYFPTDGATVKKTVSESEFISMFYRNLAAEAMVTENYTKAFWLLNESLIYAKNHSHAINMLALIYENLGYSNIADNLYQFGTEQNSKDAELLSNYLVFLKKQGRIAEANDIEKRLLSLDIKNPFERIDLGNEALAKQNLKLAAVHFKKAIEIAPYLDEGYLGLAKVHFQLGNMTKAERAFKQAKEKALGKKRKALVEAKLFALQSYDN